MSFFNNIEFSLLSKLYTIDVDAPVSVNRPSLLELYGNDFPSHIKDKFVIDFGCGQGADTKEIAEMGAKLSLGLDIRENVINDNRARINIPNCRFETAINDELKGQADYVISIDAFEHFDDPEYILSLIYDLIKPGGEALISFGPTWFHPYGGHTFSVFPWAHLLFSERSLIKWRNLFYSDNATKFKEVAGGLNQMSIKSFEKIFKKSQFQIIKFECKPIKNKKLVQRILGREFGTSMVLVHLKK